eukprot:scaffold7386_cov62-Isochrysis_galbana.AAC.1
MQPPPSGTESPSPSHLQHFIRKVDAELLKRVCLKRLEPKDIEDTDEGRLLPSLARGGHRGWRGLGAGIGGLHRRAALVLAGGGGGGLVGGGGVDERIDAADDGVEGAAVDGLGESSRGVGSLGGIQGLNVGIPEGGGRVSLGGIPEGGGRRRWALARAASRVCGDGIPGGRVCGGGIPGGRVCGGGIPEYRGVIQGLRGEVERYSRYW